MKVAHLTSVHPRFDSRIFYKECKSLIKHGYDVKLVVADGLGTETNQGVGIIDVGRPKGRWSRIFKTSRKIFTAALNLNADIYHLHDPELMPIGAKLKKHGKKVIFDAHEDFPQQILNKLYLPRFLRIPLSGMAAWYEKQVAKRLDAVVAATPYIRKKFEKFKCTVVDINNFPIPRELSEESDSYGRHRHNVCYVGSLSKARGIREMISALNYVEPDVRLKVAGKFNEPRLESELETYPAWSRVDMLGFLDRDGVKKTYQQSFAGLVVLQPIPNYLDALPVKMFEYMCAGLPVIASNFELWRDIIEEAQCGICVNPESPESIAEAINFLYKNPKKAYEIGANGKKAVLEKYNWDLEEAKLFRLYHQLLRI